MNLTEIYALMKELRRQMFQNGEQTVTLDQTEFFALYQTSCCMMQIKQITDAHD